MAESKLTEDQVVILSTQTLHDLYQEVEIVKDQNGKQKTKPIGVELVGLYMFLYYTAKWQNTNQIKATVQFIARGVGWNKDKVKKFKTILKKYNLITDVHTTDPATGKITGWYVKMNYIWKQSTHPRTGAGGVKSPPTPENQPLDYEVTNALSETITRNALSEIIILKKDIYHSNEEHTVQEENIGLNVRKPDSQPDMSSVTYPLTPEELEVMGKEFPGDSDRDLQSSYKNTCDHFIIKAKIPNDRRQFLAQMRWLHRNRPKGGGTYRASTLFEE